jgi:hypothetical protein
MIPFGANVVFRTVGPQGHKEPKFAPRSEHCLFAGYYLKQDNAGKMTFFLKLVGF